MTHSIQSVITATGRCVPTVSIPNDAFARHAFLNPDGLPLIQHPAKLLETFTAISGIRERRYAQPHQQASDLGFLAARNAVESGGIDAESLDYLIVAHNFGDVAWDSNRVNQVPSLASRIKARLAIENPNCVAYDLAFGCPGWLEGLIQANYHLRSGDARRCLVVGAETLSRVIDPHDRDSMLFGDGDGAILLEAVPGDRAGVLAHCTQTHAYQYANLLSMDKSYAPEPADEKARFMKMYGRKLYEFALRQVPLTAVDKVLLHQANEKMDAAILQRLFGLYGLAGPPADLMPMTIGWLGNSSVATIPTLLNLIRKGDLAPHQLSPGDTVVFASVGAGMNINALVYRF